MEHTILMLPATLGHKFTDQFLRPNTDIPFIPCMHVEPVHDVISKTCVVVMYMYLKYYYFV